MATLAPQDIDFTTRAPLRAEGTAVVDGTPAEVWAVLTDDESWPRWFDGVRSCRPTSEPAGGVGATRQVVIRGGTRFDERFIAWDEGRLWAFTGVAVRPGLFRALVESCTIEPLDEGRTRVTYRMGAEPAPWARPLVPALRRGFTRGLAGGMQGLAREVAARR